MAVAARDRDQLVQAVEKEKPVGETRQLVVDGATGEFLLRATRQRLGHANPDGRRQTAGAARGGQLGLVDALGHPGGRHDARVFGGWRDQQEDRNVEALLAYVAHQ